MQGGIINGLWLIINRRQYINVAQSTTLLQLLFSFMRIAKNEVEYIFKTTWSFPSANSSYLTVTQVPRVF